MELLTDSNSLISKYILYTDSLVKTVSSREPVTTEQVFDMAFNRSSHGVKMLCRFRNCLLKPLKLDTDSGVRNMIREKGTIEMLFGKADISHFSCIFAMRQIFQQQAGTSDNNGDKVSQCVRKNLF